MVQTFFFALNPIFHPMSTDSTAASYNSLKEELAKLVSKDELLLFEKAYQEAEKCYENRVLPTGKPYIWHALEVAKLAVTELGLRLPTVIAALFHSIEPVDEVAIKNIEQNYGRDAAIILRGFNRLSGLPTERLSYQSDQFRKLFLSLVEDIRVILLKIAHRIFDLRNSEVIDSAKTDRFVLEVKHLYIPITHRLGLYKLKAEFEERVLRFENPAVFESIREKIAAGKEIQEQFMKGFIAPIDEHLRQIGLESTIKWRTKSIPSIWEKMKSQNVEFEQVYDLFAIRIITKSSPKTEKEDCWRAYSIVTDLYPPNPKRLRDWITTPKASGYESLHTTVKAPDDKWVEVQIRSERMDVTAEKGQAAHWLYKDKPGKKDAEDWLNQVRDVLENPTQLQLDAYKRLPSTQDKIYIFTPNGDLKQLSGGATVLDFAYEVHTQVGASCSGARVNNKIVPIRHVLQNGDKVEIITSKKQTPRHDWLNFAVTERARSKIKRYLKEEELKDAEIGKGMLQRKLKNWKMSFNDDIINHLVKYYKSSTANELYHGIATDKIDLIELKKHLLTLDADGKPLHKVDAVENFEKVVAKSDSKDDFLIIDDSISNVNYKLARCCNPIPGDNVFGFVTINAGITIHRFGCPNAMRLNERYPYRFLKVKWKESKDNPNFNTSIRVMGKDTLGVVGEISRVISSDLKVNMRSVSFHTRDGMFDGKITLQIKDTDHLDQLVHKLLKVPGVEKVSRID